MASKSVLGISLPFSASNAVEAIAKALGEIKQADGLTYGDIGAVLGKSEDSAAHYVSGHATMDAVTFGRGKREWGSRFTGYFDRLCEREGADGLNDRACETSVLKAALALSVALADDGNITAREIHAHRQEIEDARDALGALLNRLRPAA